MLQRKLDVTTQLIVASESPVNSRRSCKPSLKASFVFRIPELVYISSLFHDT